MTRTLGRIALLGAAVLATGCMDLLSLHALHIAQDRVFDSAIEGRWQGDFNDDSGLTVERAGDRYLVTYQEKDPKEAIKYEMRLVDLDGVRFADVVPRDHVIGHFLMRVRVTGTELRLAFMDSDWLRGRVAHDEADLDGGGKQAVLTMSTADLRKIVTKYARESKAYDRKEVVFRRATAEMVAK